MKRLHVHMAVADLDEAIRFYSGLFAAPPTRQEHDYAKWQLDDPRVNFAISARGKTPGVEHLGIEAESGDELGAVQQRLPALDGRRHDEKRTTCCYAVSDKSWIVDPSGVPWEVFHTVGKSERFGQSGPDLTRSSTGGGCSPATGDGPAGNGKGGCCG